MTALQIALLCSILVALAAFGLSALFFVWVKKRPSQNETIEKISKLIANGANTFLKKEYTVLAVFAAVAAIIILLFLPKPLWQANALDNVYMMLSYICGTVFSAIAGKIGIMIATIANKKTAEAAKISTAKAFMTGYRGGAVMGMAVVGASLIGVSAIFWIFSDASMLLGFSFGASSLALFAKAGGGIFTKTADISADLVGKVELGLPEDDPRNPAVIADNVGDNVGDVAGMGADLFDSNVASLAAALVISSSIDNTAGTLFTPIVFVYALVGLLASIIGVAFNRMGKKGNPTSALNFSTYVTMILFASLTAVATAVFFNNEIYWRVYGAAVIGLAVGAVIGIATDYFTDDRRRPVKKVASASGKGPAFTVLSGISYSFYSTLPAMAGIAISALASYKLCEPIATSIGLSSVDLGMLGIAIAAVGMLSVVGMIVSNDAYGPIVDNARGLAEMGGLGDEVIARTDMLDSAGNTVKAITKGFSIGAAGLTVIALLGAFRTEVNEAALSMGLGLNYLSGFDVLDPVVFFGILVGGAVPAVFSAMLMLGVDKNARRMVDEIHRQFKEIKGLKEGKEGVMPQYDKCISIATSGSIKELIPAGLMTIVMTLAVGFIGGVKAVGGFLLGNIVTGILLALFMSNAGGLWDNSKKYIESGFEGGKGSRAHKSAVVGDTVGDPFKDTAGPSINTQITVVSLIASLTSTLFLSFSVFA